MIPDIETRWTKLQQTLTKVSFDWQSSTALASLVENLRALRAKNVTIDAVLRRKEMPKVNLFHDNHAYMNAKSGNSSFQEIAYDIIADKAVGTTHIEYILRM